ncbi:IS3 family transposase [Rhodococcus pyridinivorans]|uniref:IS3 family transposase n=1 Tax=Rhodococcus pyridinivorans TaxID=103816 RepID=UPI002078F336|nr:IS3 family transposase [Rhodococcus pyridinivorans]USI92802.1 IS3 family transposase [Rhodococcus pyridinivorans]USI92854.1 IS3 family transposase [Rhodococcus pyridinivorans]USI92907.1 IS3 family transposase [Rhodococcus pyridinivorans]WAL49108.1 IS3 family transposase [Rhodococcus pyridinivorans]
MPAPRKYDAETQERAVRMYRDRIAEHGGSKIAARRHVGELLGIAPATLRNWIEAADRTDMPTVLMSGEAVDADEVRRLRKENAELRRANEILKTASAFFGGGGGRPPTAVIVDYIDAHRKRFGVDPICAVLTEHGISIAPSTYYKAKSRGRVSATELADAYAANTVHAMYVANRRVYGVRKLWHAMKRAGHDMGRDQVSRLMTITGITGVVRGRRRTVTTERDDRAPRHPDLIERKWGAPQRPDQWWVADFTYVWTLAGFVYTAFCVDVFSRRILGWRVMTTKTTPLVHGVLEQALFTRRRIDFRFTSTGLVHHSDAGSQYTSLAFTEALVESGIAGSIGSVGDALDNALMESTIGLYKTELIDRAQSWSGRAEVERETAEWVRWFNADRLHSSIDYLSPVEYETLYREQRPTVASVLEVA